MGSGNASRAAGRAVIAGAGPVGMEIGDALHGLETAITFVVASNRVFSTILDPRRRSWSGGSSKRKGGDPDGEDIVRIGKGRGPPEIGKKRKCDIVILGKGVAPSLSFLAGSGIAVGRAFAPTTIRRPVAPASMRPGTWRKHETSCTRTTGERPLASGRGTGTGGALNMAGVRRSIRASGPEHSPRLRTLDPDGGRGRDEGPDARRSETKESYQRSFSTGAFSRG